MLYLKEYHPTYPWRHKYKPRIKYSHKAFSWYLNGICYKTIHSAYGAAAEEYRRVNK